jgi:hypothetical protein
MDTQELLVKIASQGLDSTSTDEMVELACAYWYENFSPDLDKTLQLPREQLQIIGYLTQYFSTFNCVEDARALQLVRVASNIKDVVKPSRSDNVDDIAARWELHENINKFLGDILFYQTRHYRHG